MSWIAGSEKAIGQGFDTEENTKSKSAELTVNGMWRWLSAISIFLLIPLHNPNSISSMKA
jgi:hypothetical protein